MTRVRDLPRSKTPYGFLSGFLNGLSADWSGCGPTFRRRTLPAEGEGWRHPYGQVTGALTLLGFIIVAVELEYHDHVTAAFITALVMIVVCLAANVVAARLP